MNSSRVRKLLRRFHKQFTPYRVKLAEQYGEDSALGITQRTFEEYTVLLPQTPQFRGRFNLFNWVIGLNAMIVALFKAMKADGKPPEETAKLLYEVSEKSHRSIPGLVRWVGSKAFFSRLFLKFAQRSANQVRDHPQGWKIDYRRGDTHDCDWSFECSECGVIKYFHLHGADALAPYCNYVDFIQSRAFGLGMENPQNIGQGDGVCRELFKKGRETSVPANLKSIVIPAGRANREGEEVMPDAKPSKTAYKVALNILTLGSVPEVAEVLPAGILASTERLLIASEAASTKMVRWARSRRMVSVYRAFDWMMPGQFEAFAYRKEFCERQVRESISAGCSQVLVLGAGYDTMSWRLASEFPHVGFFEIDHPATASLKAKGIETMGPRANLYLIAEDLGQRRLADVLANDEDWDRSAVTTFVAEGLLQYLRPKAVRDLFAQCASIAGAARIAFTYIPTGKDGGPDAGRWTRLVLWILKVGGEPWLWSIRPEELGPFLAATGWTYARNLDEADGKRGVELYAVATKL